MNALRLFFLVAILAASSFLGFKIYQQEKQNQILQDHKVELLDIKYGLFNVDEWKDVFSGLIAKKMNDFTIANTDEEVMKKEISAFLEKAVDGFEARYNEENKGSSITNLLKRSISSFAGIFEQVRKDIPIFTEEIYAFLTKGESQKMLKKYIEDQLDSYTKDTFLATDYTAMNNIIALYGGTNKLDTVQIIDSKIQETYQHKDLYYYLLLGLFTTTLLLLIFMKNKRKSEYLVFTAYSVLFLALGIFLPMIAIDARIEELNFPFLGETIKFKDQILFYKSKSIMEVVELMMSQGRFDLLFVGVLVMLFSVLFPISKLLSSMGYLFSPKLKRNGIIKFLTFKTGKWSMADVFVIALFMAYLGFDGLITEQLKQLQNYTNSSTILTTNNSALLFGFYAFTGFVFFSLFISQKIKGKF
jgi:hypothetical protein